MKNIISIMLIASLGVLLVFTGCKEDEVVVEPLEMVTVSGDVECELDLTNVNLESVPNGTILIFRINSQDLVQSPIAGYAYQTLQYETTVTDGKYTIELPTAVHAGVNVTVTPVDFQAEQTQADNSEEDKTFQGVAAGVTTQEGERFYLNLFYNAI